MAGKVWVPHWVQRAPEHRLLTEGPDRVSQRWPVVLCVLLCRVCSRKSFLGPTCQTGASEPGTHRHDQHLLSWKAPGRSRASAQWADSMPTTSWAAFAVTRAQMLLNTGTSNQESLQAASPEGTTSAQVPAARRYHEPSPCPQTPWLFLFTYLIHLLP